MPTKPTTTKIQSTKNYRLFKRSTDNRVTDVKQHRKLRRSMEKYGFLPCFPIVCYRNGDKQLTVKEGQHRLTFAEQLGLPVHFVETDVDFDVAAINCTPVTWKTKDYALKYSQNGIASYQEGLDFAEQHGIPIGLAFALLAGTVSFRNIWEQFVDGQFKVKDREWAAAVAGIYVPMVTLSKDLKGARFLEACMRVCRVPEFEPKRLLQGASRCREKLVPYSTMDAYLAMLEELYNFGRKQLFGLKAAAMMAMRDRCPLTKKTRSQK